MNISKLEKQYILDALLASSPLRADGRSLHDYRLLSLETGGVSLANGSARAAIGPTEALAAVKLEVEDVPVQGGKVEDNIVCTVTYTSSGTYAADLSALLHTMLSHASL